MSSPQTTPPAIEILGGGSMNKQDTGFLQSRKLEEVQLPKALPPRTGSSHVGNDGTCAAPSSAAALQKPRFLLRPSRRRENGGSQGKAEGEWWQSRSDVRVRGNIKDVSKHRALDSHIYPKHKVPPRRPCDTLTYKANRPFRFVKLAEFL